MKPIKEKNSFITGQYKPQNSDVPLHEMGERTRARKNAAIKCADCNRTLLKKYSRDCWTCSKTLCPKCHRDNHTQNHAAVKLG